MAGAAAAQDYNRNQDEPRYSAPTETVEVYAPRYRHHQERSTIGARIDNVSFSQEVRVDDLDLRTAWGAHVLRVRVQLAAQALCEEMDRRYPIATADSPPCYKDSLDRGMYQADAAIAQARGYAYRD
jgi:UrcA family protein